MDGTQLLNLPEHSTNNNILPPEILTSLNQYQAYVDQVSKCQIGIDLLAQSIYLCTQMATFGLYPW